MRLVLFILDIFFPSRETERLVRDITSASLTALLSPTHISCGDMELVALLPYRNEYVQALILEAKFHKNARAQELLGNLASTYIKVWCKNAEVAKTANSLAFVAVPLGKERRKERGYNQVEEIARFARNHMGFGILLTTAIARTRATIPQSTLGRIERVQNMQNAFGVVSSPQKTVGLNPDCIYVLIDDVVTTGATLLAARSALMKAGAKLLVVLALAH